MLLACCTVKTDCMGVFYFKIQLQSVLLSLLLKFDSVTVSHCFLQEWRWTEICVPPPRLQSLCPVRCLAQGTACSATGRHGLLALRPAPARTSRGSKWGPAPFWPTTLGKVSLHLPPASCTIVYGNVCRWGLDIGLVMAFQVVLCCHSLNVWISHLSACAFVLISNSLLICPGDYFCWSVSSPDTHFFICFYYRFSGLKLCLHLLVCLSLFLSRLQIFPCVLSGCVCVFSSQSLRWLWRGSQWWRVTFVIRVCW